MGPTLPRLLSHLIALTPRALRPEPDFRFRLARCASLGSYPCSPLVCSHAGTHRAAAALAPRRQAVAAVSRPVATAAAAAAAPAERAFKAVAEVKLRAPRPAPKKRLVGLAFAAPTRAERPASAKPAVETPKCAPSKPASTLAPIASIPATVRKATSATTHLAPHRTPTVAAEQVAAAEQAGQTPAAAASTRKPESVCPLLPSAHPGKSPGIQSPACPPASTSRPATTSRQL